MSMSTDENPQESTFDRSVLRHDAEAIAIDETGPAAATPSDTRETTSDTVVSDVAATDAVATDTVASEETTIPGPVGTESAAAPPAAEHAAPVVGTGGYLKMTLPLAEDSEPSARPRRIRHSGVRLPTKSGQRGVAAQRVQRLWHAFSARSHIQRQRHAALLVAVIGVVVALTSLGFFGADYYSPAATAAGFCTDMETHQYASAYKQLATTVRASVTQEEFTQAAQALDQGEGQMSFCVPDILPSSYHRAFGASQAATNVTVARAAHRQQAGAMSFMREGGAWRIANLDASFPGIPWGAVKAASRYCESLRAHRLLEAYTLQDDAAQHAIDLSAFATLASAADAIDGPIVSCRLATTEHPPSAHQVTLLLGVQRAHTQEHAGALTLTDPSGAWLVSAIEPTATGSDLGPLQVGTRLCDALLSNQLDQGYALFTARYQATISLTQFSDDFRPDAGARWSACAADYSSYQVKDDQATYRVNLQSRFIEGDTRTDTVGFSFTREDGLWRLDLVQFT